MDKSQFNERLQSRAESVNTILRRILESQHINKDLQEALNYTLSAPGKRIRSILLLWCYEMLKGPADNNAEIASAAVEMVHTYSLIHDDLPAMDNDDMRRGRPTCHKAFDEATAILAGDALLSLAFEILATKIDSPDIAVRLIAQLAQDAGPAGMIGGQMADLRAENKLADISKLEFIHTNKTAKMFRCAAVMGAICANATQKQLGSLELYGMKIGLCFQIADDILDVSATSEHLGKTSGKDARATKCTYPAIVGIERARELQKQLTNEAIEALENFGQKADTLRQLATMLLKRTR